MAAPDSRIGFAAAQTSMLDSANTLSAALNSRATFAAAAIASRRVPLACYLSGLKALTASLRGSTFARCQRVLDFGARVLVRSVPLSRVVCLESSLGSRGSCHCNISFSTSWRLPNSRDRPARSQQACSNRCFETLECTNAKYKQSQRAHCALNSLRTMKRHEPSRQRGRCSAIINQSRRQMEGRRLSAAQASTTVWQHFAREFTHFLGLSVVTVPANKRSTA